MSRLRLSFFIVIALVTVTVTEACTQVSSLSPECEAAKTLFDQEFAFTTAYFGIDRNDRNAKGRAAVVSGTLSGMLEAGRLERSCAEEIRKLEGGNPLLV